MYLSKHVQLQHSISTPHKHTLLPSDLVVVLKNPQDNKTYPNGKFWIARVFAFASHFPFCTLISFFVFLKVLKYMPTQIKVRILWFNRSSNT